MKPEATPFSAAMLRGVVDKSIELLESRCIRLNGRDSNVLCVRYCRRLALAF